MQENRSFDHYFGALAGVRGFGDPRPAPMPSGNYAWYQPEGQNPTSRGLTDHISSGQWVSRQPSWYQPDRAAQSSRYVLPYRMNQPGKDVDFQTAGGLDHSWKQSQDVWKNWDTWVPLKSRQSMGFLNAEDLPFYYALANAFTVCDGYHCSVFAATDPNRFYLLSGTCPPPMNFPDNYTTGGYVANIENDNNSKLTAAMYGQSAAARSAAVKAGVADWETYAETLTRNSITWKVYQENDNYGDNYLQYYKNFRIDNTGSRIDRTNDPYFQTLYHRGRAFAASSATVGESVIAQFAADVAAGAEPDGPALGKPAAGLPRVSWILAPTAYCEHPTASPGQGEYFTEKILDILINQHPDVFSKTVFMLMYDENDGYFDHVPPPVPPVSKPYGEMTLADAGAQENNGGVPVGLGPRVPMLIVSPWTAGGQVCSSVLDHASTLLFLEKWLAAKGLAAPDKIQCPYISPWRRAVCGDLTNVFNFHNTGPARLEARWRAIPGGTKAPAVPEPQSFPVLPTAVTRFACPLRYEFFVHGRVDGDGQFALQLANTGADGVALIAYWQPMANAQTPYHYTIEAGKSLAPTPVPAGADGGYDWAVYGPNGFLREFRGNVNTAKTSAGKPEVMTCYDVDTGAIRLTLDNSSARQPCVFLVTDNVYAANKPVSLSVAAGSTATLEWASAPVVNPVSKLSESSGWYDASIRLAGDASYFRRVAGCVQPKSGALYSDPAIGNAALFKPSLSLQGTSFETMRWDYVAPPWRHRPKNWIGIYPAGATPGKTDSLQWAYAPRGIGSILLSDFERARLMPGTYDAYFLFDDGYQVLNGPLTFTV
jgi:phospholipase C